MPPGWVSVPLGLAAEIRLGRQRSPDKANGPYMIPYLRAANVTWSGLDLSDVKQMDFKPAEQEVYRLRPGDILMSEASGSPGEVGKPAIWADEIPGCCFQNTLIRVRPPQGTTKYLYFQLLYFALSGRFLNDAKGVGIHHLGSERLSKIEVLVAPLVEQSRIVAVIEQYLSDIDAGVASLERVLANLKRYRAAVLKAACEGRLVPTEAQLSRQQEGREYEPGDVLLRRITGERRARWEAGKIVKAESKRRMDRDDHAKQREEPHVPSASELPPLPEGWGLSTPDVLASPEPGSICAGPFGTIFKAHDFRSVGVPIIFLRHVKAGRYLTERPGFMDRERWEELFRPYSVFGGELLVTKLGDPPGECAIYPEGIGPAMVTPDVIKMSVDEGVVRRRFLMHYLNSDTARRVAFGVAFGTTRLRMTLPLFRTLPIPVPPLVEQNRIVSEIDRLLSIADEVEQTTRAQLARAQRLRQSVLKRAFEGKLVPQDPNDEPASVLLERIRSSHDTTELKKPRRQSTRRRAPDTEVEP
ncbi:restriction endonuclease subunit S [Sorangium sp. So ce295]|uniref:restriction endonuclease subunit S n=1 Tax=Sorangium sp. So ce295 TaxID=3133295 RepID=UPI003F5E8D2D